MCPACKRIFSKNDLTCISVAHAPPQAVAKKAKFSMIKTLACSDCDNKMGKEGDRQVDFERGAFDRHKSSPPSVPAKGGDKVKIDEWIATHLYSALLIMFHRFGYEYVLSPNVDDIRSVINGKGDPLKYNTAIRDIRTVSNSCPYSQPAVCILTNPIQCFSIEYPMPCDKFVTRIILLPGFGTSAMESYDRFLQLDPSTQFNPKGDILGFNEFGFLRDHESKGYGERLWRRCITANKSSIGP
jgi:hypothetical protein